MTIIHVEVEFAALACNYPATNLLVELFFGLTNITPQLLALQKKSKIHGD